MLECPRCGKPEVERIKQDTIQHVLFGCMLMVTLPTDKTDEELQHDLDTWERTGGLEEWLKTPMFSKGYTVVVIEDKKLIGKVKKHFDKLWKESKSLEEL